MQTLSTLEYYQQVLQADDFQSDEVQRTAVIALNKIQQAIIQRGSAPKTEDTGWLGRLSRVFAKRNTSVQDPLPGLYMWGGVGRGKTWLMDLFYESIPGERKLRLHFHRFMQRVHQELTELQGESDPILIIADRFKAETDLLCFDEFFVSDITDAMLLGTLMQALFKRGMTLVATSNIPPDQLYRNGLQRARFLPAIEQIIQHCEIMNVDAGIDYRMRSLTAAHLWKSPLNTETQQAMEKLFKDLSGCVYSSASQVMIEINHRPMQSERITQGVAVFTFQVLCGENRSQYDYIVLSQRFHTLLLLDVPQLYSQQEDQARRFLALVDEFYERHVKLVVSAEVPLEEFYQGDRLKFEYQRCLSRLQEMQSEEYLHLPHKP